MGLSEASRSRERLLKVANAGLINNAPADFGAAKLLNKDEGRRIAVNVAKLPELLRNP
jgi:hypothetical protein